MLLATALAPADPQWADFLSALRNAALPITDLGDGRQYFFSFADQDGGAGYGGFLLTDGEALVRSVVVASARRGQGLGAQMVAWLTRQAREAGAARAWLLTDTAAPFFKRIGFVETARANAPPPITRSREFSELCPSSAVLMCQTLV